MKSKGTAAFWLTVVGAAFIPIVSFIRLVARPDHFIRALKKDPWQMFINDNWQAGAFFLLPVFAILVTSLVVQTEYKNNTWKQVYASPRSILDIFMSRFIVIHTLILLAFVLFNAFIIITACAANLVQKGYNFFDHPVPWKTLFALTAKLYFSVLAITAIQYWLSLRFRNFIIPLGIGLALLVTGFMILQWDQLYFYPYMYPVVFFWPSFQKNPALVDKAQVFNMIWFALVLLIALWDMATRKEKG
ncbi:ABC transporter permease [Longitalea arenae]|uniref:ABC transporter permease n=1 Tax=Longitalea arenae TaxID=2812558 RepID=UPI0019688789|nr:ABC transporter permease [Longitalea arenae]